MPEYQGPLAATRSAVTATNGSGGACTRQSKHAGVGTPKGMNHGSRVGSWDRLFVPN